MKKNSLLILLLFFVLKVSGQNCNFIAQTNPGTTSVSFIPHHAFLQGGFSFVWNFGDGTTDTSPFPVHTYNGAGPFIACYDIYDSTNAFVCGSCDTINFTTVPVCLFTYSVTSAPSTITFTASTTISGNIVWDFGDGSTDTGASVTHTYSPGNYTVLMAILDQTSGNILCTYNDYITIGGSTNCSFTSTINGPTGVFVAQNVSPNTNVTWSFGDGATGSGYQATHTYNFSGTYTVCMFAVDFNGNACQSCDTIYVTTLPGNCFFTSTPDPLDPNTYNFTATPAYPNSTITWNFGDGTTATGYNVSHTYSAPGTYSVCIAEVDSANVPQCTSCQTILIHNVNNCSFTYQTSLVNPLTINFQANGVNSITWDFGDGTIDTGASVTHTYATAGIYNVCITQGMPGTTLLCTTCLTVAVGNPNSYCAISYYPDPFQPGTFIFSSTQSSSSSMIVWDFGDNTIGTGQTITHTYSQPGTYAVCIIERDSMQLIICQSCITVTVGNGGSNPCQASFLAASNGLDAYFIDMSNISTATTTYAWDFGDGSTSGLQFPQHTYSMPGTYNVCLIISDANCTDTFCSPLWVDTLGHNPANGCNAFYATVQLAPYQVAVVNLSSGFNLSFDWDFGDGSPHDYNAYPSHYYTTTGSFNLCLTVTDANGCSSTYCDTLNVDTLGNIFRFASPGFTLNVLSPAAITGVNEVSPVQTFGVYPNPFTSEIQISMSNGLQATDYRILNIQGAEVLKGRIDAAFGKIQAQSLTPGIYLMEVNMTDGSRSYQRIIKN